MSLSKVLAHKGMKRLCGCTYHINQLKVLNVFLISRIILFVIQKNGCVICEKQCNCEVSLYHYFTSTFKALEIYFMDDLFFIAYPKSTK